MIEVSFLCFKFRPNNIYKLNQRLIALDIILVVIYKGGLFDLRKGSVTENEQSICYT